MLKVSAPSEGKKGYVTGWEVCLRRENESQCKELKLHTEHGLVCETLCAKCWSFPSVKSIFLVTPKAMAKIYREPAA